MISPRIKQQMRILVIINNQENDNADISGSGFGHSPQQNDRAVIYSAKKGALMKDTRLYLPINLEKISADSVVDEEDIGDEKKRKKGMLKTDIHATYMGTYNQSKNIDKGKAVVNLFF